MYIPRHFAAKDEDAVKAIIRRYDFGLLCAVVNGVPEAAHLPFLLDATRGPAGTLIAHMARPNPLSRSLTDQCEVLVVFQGPHSYISPTWHASPGSVPTWNYAAVHAYGVPRLIDDAVEVRSVLMRLVEVQEAGFAEPWQIEPRPGDLIEKMAPGIVAFEIPIARLEGKFKLSQNKTAADRAGVVTALRARGETFGVEVASLMEAHAPSD